jgi:sporulation protein YlmC with PRC-barrel domain
MKLTRYPPALLALALPLMVPAYLHAGSTGETKSKSGVVAAKYKVGQSADDIIGQDVRSSTGQDLGEVDDILINPLEGHVVYALISTGGFLGVGDTVHVVPFSAFASGAVTDHALILNLQGKAWKTSPTIKSDQIADLAAKTRSTEIYGYFNRDWDKDLAVTHAPAMTRSDRLMKVSEISGSDVLNGGRKVGTIEDVIVDFTNRRATALLDPDDDYTGTDQKFAISFDQLTPSNSERHQLLTKLTPAQFEKATPIREDWASTTTTYPYVWSYGAAYAGIAPEVMAQRTPVAEVRRSLRNDTNIGRQAENIQITRHNDELVLRGRVMSESLKKQIGDKAEQVAKGWAVKNDLSIGSTSE